MENKDKEQVLTSSLRDSLKEVMEKEIQRLPEYLEALEPKERLNAMCKLMVFVFPKVESVSLNKGEPVDYDIMRN